jgi:hypothetical protein
MSVRTHGPQHCTHLHLSMLLHESRKLQLPKRSSVQGKSTFLHACQRSSAAWHGQCTS